MKVILIILIISCNKKILNEKSKSKIDFLKLAIRNQDLDSTKRIIENLDLIDIEKEFILHDVVKLNNKELLQILLNKNINPYIKNRKNKYAIELIEDEEIKTILVNYIKEYEIKDAINCEEYSLAISLIKKSKNLEYRFIKQLVDIAINKNSLEIVEFLNDNFKLDKMNIANSCITSNKFNVLENIIDEGNINEILGLAIEKESIGAIELLSLYLLDNNINTIKNYKHLKILLMNNKNELVKKLIDNLIKEGIAISDIATGDISIFEFLGKNSYLKDLSNNELILICAKGNYNQKIEKYIIEPLPPLFYKPFKGRVDKNYTDKDNNNAYKVALLNENFEICSFLENKGWGMDEKELKEVIIKYTKENKSSKIITSLINLLSIKTKSLVDYIKNSDLLNISVKNGHKEVVDLLLNKGANVNDKNKNNCTALYIASTNGHKEVVDLLLNKGANVNDKNKNNCTALYIASTNGHKEVADLLLNKGANVNDKEVDGWTALMIASQNGHKEVAELLLNNGANVNDKEVDGWTALMIASQNGHKEVAELLLNKGANVNK